MKSLESSKTIVISCTKGIWKATFSSQEGETPITVPDLSRVKRALKFGHRVYVRDLNLSLRLARRKAEEAQASLPEDTSKVSAMKGTDND